MTLVKDAAVDLIAQFGEEVTVLPKDDREPSDSTNPIYFDSTDSEEDSFTVKARVYTSPDNETLESYGFESDTEAIIYETDGNIENGDEIDIFGDIFVVDQIDTNQIGNGVYIYVYKLVGV